MSLQRIQNKIVQAVMNRIVKEMDYNEKNLRAVDDVLKKITWLMAIIALILWLLLLQYINNCGIAGNS